MTRGAADAAASMIATDCKVYRSGAIEFRAQGSAEIGMSVPDCVEEAWTQDFAAALA